MYIQSIELAPSPHCLLGPIPSPQLRGYIPPFKFLYSAEDQTQDKAR